MQFCICPWELIYNYERMINTKNAVKQRWALSILFTLSFQLSLDFSLLSRYFPKYIRSTREQFRLDEMKNCSSLENIGKIIKLEIIQ